MNFPVKTLSDLIRLKQPAGTVLLILPCLFAIALIYKTHDVLLSKLLAISLFFCIGAFLMRSAGCIINDLFDRNFDKKVERTKNRPIASKKISIRASLIFLAILLIASFLILIQFNKQTIIAGFVAVALTIIYPLTKRITYFPQVFLGLTFNFGIILANLAILGQVSASCIILYLASIFWTLFYDTIYGFQDIEDDLKIGLKSTSIAFAKKNPKNILYRICLIFTLFFIMLGVVEELNLPYFIIIIFSGFFALFKMYKCNLDKPAQCLSLFKYNMIFGLLFLMAILFG